MTLRTDDERDHFIKQFWMRRDPLAGLGQERITRGALSPHQAMPTTGSPDKIPGWKTDSGRIYIHYGPPDEIESHPSGRHV